MSSINGAGSAGAIGGSFGSGKPDGIGKTPFPDLDTKGFTAVNPSNLQMQALGSVANALSPFKG